MDVVVLTNEVPDGAAPDDLDTVVQREEVTRALVSAGHSVRHVTFALDLRGTIDRLGTPDVVFNLVESLDGRAALQTMAPLLLEHLRLPFTGGGSRQLIATTDKIFTKRMLRGAGLPTPAWYALGEGERIPPGTLILKPTSEDGSIGIDDDRPFFKGGSEDELSAVLTERRSRGVGEWFAEQFIDGRELQVAYMETEGGDTLEPLPAFEVPFDSYPEGQPRIYGYRAKWIEGSHEWDTVIPTCDLPASDMPLLRRIEELGLRALKQLDVRSYARVDFRIDGDGEPWILEINVNPCLSQEAMFFWAAEQRGFNEATLMERLVRSALARHRRFRTA